MASGFVTWHCNTSYFHRFLIACSNEILAPSRSDRPTIAKRADDRPGPKHLQACGGGHLGVTGYGGQQPGVAAYGEGQPGVTAAAPGSGAPSLVKRGGAKSDAPDVPLMSRVTP